MSLVERIAADRLGILAKDTTTGATTLCVFLDGEAAGRDFFTVNLGTNGGKPATSRATIEKLFAQLSTLGPIYATVDTYLALAFQTGMLSHDRIAGVFPWAAEEPCKITPHVSEYTNAICRNVGLYYWQLHHHPMIDWAGVTRTFAYRASNTLTFRAKAPYHNIERGLRANIMPVPADHYTVQFDWSAAEFNLILQHLGYQPPEDAYGDFTAAGLDRDLTKLVVLAHIYGARDETLYAKADGNAAAVDAIIAHLRLSYPKVLEWREQCIHCRLAEFNGFRYDLGDVEYKRPNHWAQTALQLCKWELLSRLVCAGVHTTGAGDLHDQLYFDVDPINGREVCAEVINQIRALSFGRYNLRPKFKAPARAWG